MQRLRVLTLNTWFLPGLAQHISRRAKRFAALVASADADIIALQEVWMNPMKEKFVQEFAQMGYPYSHYTKAKRRISLRGVLGNGLVTLSKFPLQNVGPAIRFRNFTHPAEYFVDKGAIHSLVKHPRLGEFDFFNVHLGAPRWKGKSSAFNVKDTEIIFNHGEVLAEEVGRRSLELVKILAGDFNFHRLTHTAKDSFLLASQFSREYNLIQSKLNVKGSVEDLSPEKFNTVEMSNPYFSNGIFKNTPPRQLDHVFYSPELENISEISTRVVFDQDPISDHYGVMTDFNFQDV